jgi:hypothetical protein
MDRVLTFEIHALGKVEAEVMARIEVRNTGRVPDDFDYEVSHSETGYTVKATPKR